MKNKRYQLLDVSNLLQSVNGDSKFVVELMKIYLKNSNEKIQELENYYEDCKKEGVAKTAHFIKGSVCALGECELSLNLKQLEIGFHEIESNDYQSLYVKVKEQLNVFSNEIKEFINDHSGQEDK